MAIVKFLPSGTEVDVEQGENLYRAAHAAGVAMASVCGGLGSCTGCRVRILEGEEYLSPMGYKERERLGNTFFITKERLACQTTTSGPLVVEVLQEQQRDKRERARRRALDRTLENAQRRAQRHGESSATNGQGAGNGPGSPLDPPERGRVAAGGPAVQPPNGPARPDPAHGQSGNSERSRRRRRSRPARGPEANGREFPPHEDPRGGKVPAPSMTSDVRSAAGEAGRAAQAAADPAGGEGQPRRRRRRRGGARHRAEGR